MFRRTFSQNTSMRMSAAEFVIASFSELFFFAAYSIIPPVRSPFSTNIFLVIFCLHALFSTWIIHRLRRTSTVLSNTTLFGIFLLTRTTIFPMLPWLSDDVFGYVFYGHELLHGINPYHFPANAAEISYLRNDAYKLMAFTQHPAIYPPYSIYCFTIATHFGQLFSDSWQAAFYSWKFALLFHELSAVLIILFSTLRKNISRQYLLAYLIMPLPAVEIAGQGHCDGLILPYLTLFLYIANIIFQRTKDGITDFHAFFFAGLITGALAAIKIIPAVVSGILIRLIRPKYLLKQLLCILVGLCISVGVISFPLLHDGLSYTNFFSILEIYNNTYFNSPLLMAIRFILEICNVETWWLIAPKILTVLRLISVILLLWFVRPNTFSNTISAVAVAYSAVIFISPKVHVWYVVPVLFLTTFTRQRWLVVISYGTIFSYLMYGFSEQTELIILESFVWVVSILYVWFDVRKNGLLNHRSSE